MYMQFFKLTSHKRLSHESIVTILGDWSFQQFNFFLKGSVDDLQVVKDSLSSLRVCFKGGDPQLHTLDTLEHSVSSLLEKNQQNNSTSSNGSHQVSAHFRLTLCFEYIGRNLLCNVYKKNQ